MDAMNGKDELDGNLARALDALEVRAQRAAGKVDAELVAAAVLKRLRTGDVEPVARPLWQLTLVRAAAVLVLMAASALAVARFVSPPGSADALPVAMQAAEFSAGDFDSMMTAVEEARSASRAGAVTTSVTVYDLNEQELVALLTALNEPVEKT
jgi:hypothetical protein